MQGLSGTGVALNGKTLDLLAGGKVPVSPPLHQHQFLHFLFFWLVGLTALMLLGVTHVRLWV